MSFHLYVLCHIVAHIQQDCKAIYTVCRWLGIEKKLLVHREALGGLGMAVLQSLHVQRRRERPASRSAVFKRDQHLVDGLGR